MYQLVLHHTYIGGSTFDVSGLGNHGLPEDITPGTGDADGSYQFTEPTSGITVATSPTLQNLTALRVRMKIRTEAPDGQRRNLMEGFLSFAFILSGDGHLAGSIVDRAGNWNGLQAPDPLPPNTWHEIEMTHDGFRTLALKIDGRPVAVRSDIQGPVRSVGALGLAIGRWPDAHSYVYKGHIGELQVWRYDAERTAIALLDCCCDRDPALLDPPLSTLRDAGVDWTRLRAAANELQGSNLELAGAVANAGEASASDFENLLAQARVALHRRDTQQLQVLRRRAESLIDQVAGQQPRRTWERNTRRIARTLGLTDARIGQLLHAWCLDHLGPASDSPQQPPTTSGGEPWNDVPIPDPFRTDRTPPRDEPR